MSSGAKLINKTNWLIWLSILMAFKTNDQQINESIRARHNPLMKCCHTGNTHTVRILLSLTSLALACVIFVHRGTIWPKLGLFIPDPGSFSANDWRHWYQRLFSCRPTERSISPWVKELNRDFDHEILWCPAVSYPNNGVMEAFQKCWYKNWNKGIFSSDHNVLELLMWSGDCPKGVADWPLPEVTSLIL